MSSFAKIVIGAVLTTVLAWFLHGPMKFGERCAVSAGMDVAPAAVVPAVMPPVDTAEAEVVDAAPASAEAVKSCQAKVNTALSGGTINFTSGGAIIAAASLPLLDTIATELAACGGTVVEVGGHTDLEGAAAFNQDLSNRRANAVVAALVERGVSAGSLTAKGYGETSPIDTSGPENNPVNRRIAFTIASSAAN